MGSTSGWWWSTLAVLLAAAAGVIVVAMREARKLRARDGVQFIDKEDDMHATVGDEIVVDQSRVGAPPRKGDIIEVRSDADTLHYVVRWDDGHESVFFPGSDAHVVTLH